MSSSPPLVTGLAALLADPAVRGRASSPPSFPLSKSLTASAFASPSSNFGARGCKLTFVFVSSWTEASELLCLFPGSSVSGFVVQLA